MRCQSGSFAQTVRAIFLLAIASMPVVFFSGTAVLVADEYRTVDGVVPPDDTPPGSTGRVSPDPPVWHPDLGGQALDFVGPTSGEGGTLNRPVEWRSWHVDGDLMTATYAGDLLGTTCSGINIVVRDADNVDRARFNFTHIAKDQGLAVGTSWVLSDNYGWTSRSLGTITSEVAPCAWTGAHLHQGADCGTIPLPHVLHLRILVRFR